MRAIDHSTAQPATTGATAEVMTLWELVARLREDWETHQRDWSRPGLRALAAYRLAAWRRSRRNPLVRYGLAFPARSLLRYARNHYGIELYATARIGRRVLIGHQGGIVIHELAEIGDDVVILQGCTVGAVNQRRYEAPVLESRVKLGAGAVIVGKVRVGHDARIGPNAVVFRDVPPGSLVLAPQSRVFEPPPQE
jgi:serine O-acetyltransferase